MERKKTKKKKGRKRRKRNNHANLPSHMQCAHMWLCVCWCGCVGCVCGMNCVSTQKLASRVICLVKCMKVKKKCRCIRISMFGTLFYRTNFCEGLKQRMMLL